jgi:hypothetical protein
MDALLSQHLPIITNQLEFFPQRNGPPPTITPRIDFTNKVPPNVTTKESGSTDEDEDMIEIDNNNATPPADVGNSGDEESDYLCDLDNKKILKPRGQAGHPGSGGYSLEVVLRKWGSTVITSVNVNHDEYSSDINHIILIPIYRN